MSNISVPPVPPPRGSKKRRNPGSCALCKKKKIKCDRSLQPNGNCSNCIAFDIPCVFEAKPVEKIFVTPKPSSRVSSLESRLRQVESQLNEMKQSGDPNYDECGSIHRQSAAMIVNEILENHESSIYLQNPELTSETMLQLAQYARSLEQELHANSHRDSLGPPFSLTEDSSEEDEEGAEDIARAAEGALILDDALGDQFHRFTIHDSSASYIGGSSDVQLLTNVVRARKAAEGSSNEPAECYFVAKRPEFWSMRPYDLPGRPIWRPAYTYPDNDLLEQLISLYFFHVNSILPLLHFPTFQRDVNAKLHHRNHLFGGTVLMVCALGALYSDDPRIFKEGAHPSSRGWKYYDEIHPIVTFHDNISLWELQVYCLSALFLSGCSPGSASWTVIGVGLRYAQEIGVHRKRKGPITADYELWKRAFWCLIVIDRLVSCLVGRPCGLADEDIDVELPIECDDEYWDHPDPELSWKQPPSKPSVITHFNYAIRLTRILIRASRTVYAVKKPKFQGEMTRQEWVVRTVADLDGELAKWRNGLPAHLAYDPKQRDTRLYQQSVSCLTTYYMCQIQIHRCLISSSPQASEESVSSTLVCLNAARACCDLVIAQHERGLWHLPHTQAASFNSAIILIMNLYSSPSKTSADSERLKKVMNVLKDSEVRWRHAGRLWDILMELTPSSLKTPGFQAAPSNQNTPPVSLPSWIASSINEPSPLVSQDPFSLFTAELRPNSESFLNDTDQSVFGVEDWWSSYFSTMIPNNSQWPTTL